jgi:hypothetical protein
MSDQKTSAVGAFRIAPAPRDQALSASTPGLLCEQHYPPHRRSTKERWIPWLGTGSVAVSLAFLAYCGSAPIAPHSSSKAVTCDANTVARAARAADPLELSMAPKE